MVEDRIILRNLRYYHLVLFVHSSPLRQRFPIGEQWFWASSAGLRDPAGGCCCCIWKDLFLLSLFSSLPFLSSHKDFVSKHSLLSFLVLASYAIKETQVYPVNRMKNVSKAPKVSVIELQKSWWSSAAAIHLRIVNLFAKFWPPGICLRFQSRDILGPFHWQSLLSFLHYSPSIKLYIITLLYLSKTYERRTPYNIDSSNVKGYGSSTKSKRYPGEVAFGSEFILESEYHR